jgi:hypothetical protein
LKPFGQDKYNAALLDILQNNEVGRIIEVEASFSDGQLRAVDELPVDAVLLANDPEGNNFLYQVNRDN